MSLKKYLSIILPGVVLGITTAYLYNQFNQPMSATRSIASTKLARMNQRHYGKVGAPIFVQISKSSDSEPERGYYKLVGHITFNQPIHNLNYQWALPLEARLISGEPEG